MERYAELTKERLLNIKCRVNEASVPRILRFQNADGSPKDISGLDFEIPVKRQPTDTRNIFLLTIGDGLTVQGDDNDELLIEVSDEIATQKPNVYFWRLFSAAENNTWLNGDWDFFIGKYDGITQTDTITIDESGEVVLITITQEGISQAELEEALNTRTSSATSSATLTPDIDNYDLFVRTAQAEALTIANPTGTPVNGNGFMIDLEDDGNAQTITFGNGYSSIFVALPTTTIAGKRMKMVFQYNSVTSKHELLNVINEL